MAYYPYSVVNVPLFAKRLVRLWIAWQTYVCEVDIPYDLWEGGEHLRLHSESGIFVVLENASLNIDIDNTYA